MRPLVLTLLACSLAAAQTRPVSIESPDGRLQIRFQTVTGENDQPSPNGGRLVYDVAFKGDPVITPSGLGLDIEGRDPLGAAVQIVSSKAGEGVDAYDLPHGKTSRANDPYRSLRLDLAETGAYPRKLAIEARAYNDGVAFRYIVPDSGVTRDMRLRQEHTEFRLPNDAMTWALELPSYHTMYESEYLPLPLTAFANRGGVTSEVLIGLPLLMELPGKAWIALTEADLRGTSSMYVTNPSGSWTGYRLESRLAPDPDEPGVVVTSELPYQSAWRVLLISDRVGDLIESTVITSLNPPSKIEDTSWIKPGKSSWDWWSGSINASGKSDYSTKTLEYYADFAAQSGFDYVLVDAGWSALDDVTKMNGRVDIPELVKYAGAKGVKVLIWAHWAALDRQLEAAFSQYEDWGVAGVKIDFMSRDDQRMMRFYYRVAEAGLRHRLMVDFHGSTKPTGLQRTYPNVMGYEAVLGMEQSKAGSRDNPESHVTLPFTRMLVGEMDYTPGGFRNVTRDAFKPSMTKPVVQGTRAHQLAMYVVFDAPFQMVSDDPQAYEGEPGFDFIKAVPTKWDETHVVDGRPGEYVVVARRRGDDWYLGAMTDWSPRTLEIPLDFLGEGTYTAEISADGPQAAKQPTRLTVTKRSGLDRRQSLKAELASGGGYVVRLVKR